MTREIDTVDFALREGKFQRWLSLIVGLSSAMSGAEVAYEHYKGSYSNPIMYTPPLASVALFAAGVAGFFSRKAARTVLPVVSAITLADCAIGFGFHVRGIARKPGGWSLPVTNVVMGPPIFAPLLFGISAYMGIVASTLQRNENTGGSIVPKSAHASHWANGVLGDHEPIDDEQNARETRYRQHLAIAAALSTALSALEAAYSHYKNNFQYNVQWTPLIVAPVLMATAAGAVKSRHVAQTWFPAVCGIAMLNGALGFGFHLRGTVRRSGGLKKPLYNLIYGPPVFAPLLFAAGGFLGILGSLLGSEVEL